MPDLEEVALAADIIVNGYAFTQQADCVRALNLNRPTSAAVFGRDGSIWETTMDDIELAIVRDYLERNAKYLTV